MFIYLILSIFSFFNIKNTNNKLDIIIYNQNVMNNTINELYFLNCFILCIVIIKYIMKN